MAYAAARFGESCLRGFAGEADIYECAYVESTACEGLAYFATKCKLGKDGIDEVLPMGDLTAFEKAGLEKAKAELTGSIAKGIKFAAEK
eukprot:6661224-Pyramimonas_sp.AAC.1